MSIALPETQKTYSKIGRASCRERVFDKQLMRQLVENCGGVINELSTYFIKPFTHTQMYACLENNIFTDQVLEGLWNMSRYLPEYGAELYCDCGLE